MKINLFVEFETSTSLCFTKDWKNDIVRDNTGSESGRCDSCDTGNENETSSWLCATRG